MDTRVPLRRKETQMAETPRPWLALRSALQEAGADETEFLDEAVSLLRNGLSRQPSIDPKSQFTQAEVEILRRGGLALEPRSVSEPDVIARTAARASVMFIESKTAGDVAKTLGVSAARVRQRAIERTLYAIRNGDTWRFPAWQFDPDTGHEILGLAAVIPSISRTLHPIAVFRFLDEPSPDLEIDDEPTSPLRWLATGGDPAPVAEIAAAL
jgi:hypothetical protein